MYSQNANVLKRASFAKNIACLNKRFNKSCDLPNPLVFYSGGSAFTLKKFIGCEESGCAER